MDQKPKIPTLKEAPKPQVKIRGLSAGLTVLDRLKQFRKKDLAFIAAGLCTLFMAPLAEHFMMAPESGDATMGPGWGGKSGGAFGAGGSPYEGGLTGLAPGSAIGGGSDLITPLNVRDPSSLVMGPGAANQPPAGSAAPPAPPSGPKESDIRDALANAAASAASASTKSRAPMPVPSAKLTNSGLRGLGAVAGGSSASGGLSPLRYEGRNRGGEGGGGGLANVRGAPGFRGPADARSRSGGSSAAERLKQAAGGAGDVFNRGGAADALTSAASHQIPSGSANGGAGGGGAGGADKGPGGNNTPGSKSVGESLEFLRRKSEQEKALDLKWKKREKREMFPLELMQDTAKNLISESLTKPLGTQMGKLVGGMFGTPPNKVVQCQRPASEGGGWEDIPNACMNDGRIGYRNQTGDNESTCQPVSDTNPLITRTCREVSMSGTPSPSTTCSSCTARAEGTPGDITGTGGTPAPSGMTLAQVCTELGSAPAQTDPAVIRLAQSARTLSNVLVGMQGASAGTECSLPASVAASYTRSGDPVSVEQARLWDRLRANADALKANFADVKAKYGAVATRAGEIPAQAATNGEARRAAQQAQEIIGGPEAQAITAANTAYTGGGAQFVDGAPAAGAAQPPSVNKAGVTELLARTNTALGVLDADISSARVARDGAASGLAAVPAPAAGNVLTHTVAEYTAKLQEWAAAADRVVTQKGENSASIRREVAANAPLAALNDAAATAIPDADGAIRGTGGTTASDLTLAEFKQQIDQAAPAAARDADPFQNYSALRQALTSRVDSPRPGLDTIDRDAGTLAGRLATPLPGSPAAAAPAAAP